jgi:ribosomal protein S18 acetylase RimI-like enzyme
MSNEPVAVRVCAATDAESLGPEFAARWEGQRAGRWELLTAWFGSRLVGSGLLRWEGPFNPHVAAVRPGQVEIGFLQVEPEWRGRGVGSALLALAEQRCRARGVRSLGLGVGIDNSRAAALYRRLGFADTGVRFTDAYVSIDRDGCTHDVVEPGLYMTRMLTADGERGS